MKDEPPPKTLGVWILNGSCKKKFLREIDLVPDWYHGWIDKSFMPEFLRMEEELEGVKRVSLRGITTLKSSVLYKFPRLEDLPARIEVIEPLKEHIVNLNGARGVLPYSRHKLLRGRNMYTLSDVTIIGLNEEALMYAAERWGLPYSNGTNAVSERVSTAIGKRVASIPGKLRKKKTDK
jgi:hypothetical protein